MVNLVNEIDTKKTLTTEEILRREHATTSGSRKIINGPYAFVEHETEDRVDDPVQVGLTASSAEMDMDLNTAYRLIGSSGMHFRMSKGSSAATTSDIYLPANQTMIIQSGRLWDKVSVIKASGESDGIAQIMPLK